MTNYELFWDKGEQTPQQYYLLSERQSNTYIVDTTGIESKKFHFYVQAVTQCGKGS